MKNRWISGILLKVCVTAVVWMPPHVGSAEPTRKQLDFFESRIRPVLIEHCYECHNSHDAAEGELAVDHRAVLLKGGAAGPIVVPGKPAESRLLAVLKHEVEGLEMPQNGPKLDAHVIADFETWIADGAVDPRDKAPSAAELAAATGWDAVLQRRKQWWSFQPIRSPVPPGGNRTSSVQSPIDQFIEARRKAAGLMSAPPAEPAQLIRRLYYSLTGLPPSRQEAEQWTARLSDAGNEQQHEEVITSLVDHLLASPRFGERWARHWMDWVRYAESHGSEGDPEIAQAWMYRDYLIRALNADVPFDHLLREHVAGDLLKHPRINEELGINESLIGPAHWRMVFHGFAPTDALDEKVRFIDDQINAFSKAFLGLTVSCARCHNHKFDAISQKDYYALFGVLGSCRPGRTVIDVPERVNRNRSELETLKPQIRNAVAKDWLASIDDLSKRIAVEDGLAKNAEKPDAVLHLLRVIHKETAKGTPFGTVWQRQLADFETRLKDSQKQKTRSSQKRWDLAETDDYAEWFPNGTGLPSQPHHAGEFAVSATGELALTGIYPAGVYSHSVSAKHAARLTSDDIIITAESELWVRALGDSGAMLRYVVQDYPRNGTVYPVTKLANSWRWQRYDLSYWTGDDIHIELTSAADAPLLTANQALSWFGIREARLVNKGEPAPIEVAEFLKPVFQVAADAPPASFDDLADIYTSAITEAIKKWAAGSVTDAQAILLDSCLKQSLLSNRLDTLEVARPLINKYRKLEEEIPVPTRVPGLDETTARNQPLFERGNHKLPGDDVPRRFLEAIDTTPYETSRSGRLELAEDLLRDDNPLTRRVIVNRVWHHLFGHGIVRTPDNFGRLGDQPSHPDLLDWLAIQFVKDGWSLKTLIRKVVLSKTWQQSSEVSERSQDVDPDNRLLSHANVRRLEAEAIRDLLLTVSGQIDHRIGGDPVPGNSPRRSVYVRVRRNALDPFLRAFDFPEPFTAVGRRDVTNVPAQSLTIMNDSRTSTFATSWAQRVVRDASLTTPAQRIETMFHTAFGRPATAEEIERTISYLEEVRRDADERMKQRSRLQEQVAARRQQINDIKSPVRRRLLNAARKNSRASQENLPQPIGRWEFDKSISDQTGPADGQFKSGARLSDGALVVTKGGYVVTRPIEKTLKAKTLEAWVQLDNLQQRGGGVMTIQTPNGVTFDSIVFGERDPQQWLAGSNGFVRTQPFGGPREKEADSQPVHVAIVYHDDGRIVGYWNGRPYGKSYKSNGPIEFKAGNAIISFGVRHLPAVGNRMLAGRILKARLYDHALSAEEVAATSGASPAFVPESRVLAELSAADRATIERLTNEVDALNADTRRLGAVPKVTGDLMLWTELARAIFTFKEFIYVR